MKKQNFLHEPVDEKNQEFSLFDLYYENLRQGRLNYLKHLQQDPQEFTTQGVTIQSDYWATSGDDFVVAGPQYDTYYLLEGDDEIWFGANVSPNVTTAYG